MRTIITVIISFFMSFPVFSQQSAVMYNMKNNPVRNTLNPAYFPMQKAYIGMPLFSGISVSFTNSGFTYSDLIKKDSDDSLYIDVANAINSMKGENLINVNTQIDLFNAGIVIGKKYFVGISAAERVHMNLLYNKDLFGFAYYGNEAYLGEEANIEIKLDATHFREYAISFATELTDKFSVGTRLKYLYGMENVSTKKTSIHLYTDPTTFAITASGNIGINTSGLSNFSDTENFNMNQYLFGKSNSGFAFDFGVQAKPVKNLILSAAVTDLGSIKWKDDAINYNAAHVNNEFTFSGIDINELLGADDIEQALTDYADSLASQFFLDTTYYSYTSTLPFSFSSGIQYNLTKKISTGLLYQGYSFRDYLSSTLSANLAITLGKKFNSNVVYSMGNNGRSALGLGIGLTFLQMHWYLVSDNVMAFVKPQEAKSTSIRTGILMTFGK